MIISSTYNLEAEEWWRLSQLQEIYLECDTTTGPVTINLFPIIDLERFWNIKIYVSDISNNASANPILIVCDPTDTINYSGFVSSAITTDGGRGELFVTSENQWAFVNASPLIYTAYDQVQDHGVNMPQRNTLDFQGGGVIVTDNGSKTIATILSGNSFGLFAQTADSGPIANTTTEGTLIDGGIGTLTVPPNSFQIGDSFIASMSGIISSKNNTTLRLRIKAGSIILGDTGFITMPQTTNKHFDIESHFTIRAIGGVGVASIVTSGTFTYSKDASNAFEGDDFSTVNNTTFDTTIGNTLNITAQWGASEIQNNIYSQYFTLNKIF